jgi:hypothetical protein
MGERDGLLDEEVDELVLLARREVRAAAAAVIVHELPREAFDVLDRASQPAWIAYSCQTNGRGQQRQRRLVLDHDVRNDDAARQELDHPSRGRLAQEDAVLQNAGRVREDEHLRLRAVVLVELGDRELAAGELGDDRLRRLARGLIAAAVAASRCSGGTRSGRFGN